MDDERWAPEWFEIEDDEREARAEARAIQRHAQAQAWEDRHTGMQLEPFRWDEHNDGDEEGDA